VISVTGVTMPAAKLTQRSAWDRLSTIGRRLGR
jgi:hypothetical protein